MIDITKARQSIERLRAFKMPLTYREYDGAHEITADAIQDLSAFLMEAFWLLISLFGLAKPLFSRRSAI